MEITPISGIIGGQAEYGSIRLEFRAENSEVV
jgi:hypothetical protein